MNKSSWIPELYAVCSEFAATCNEISQARKTQLEAVSAYIIECKKLQRQSQLMVICTHNSRRSHFGQVWLQIAGYYYDQDIQVYSGGTTATAFHPNAINAIKRCGFEVSCGEGSNPACLLTYSTRHSSITCFSKSFDHSDNPQQDFGAILVCDHAAENCPFIPGADRRFVIPYHDPKTYDGTPWEKAKYDERCREIGREMFYLVSCV